LEDGGAAAAGNAGNNSRARGKFTSDLDANPFGLGAIVVDNGGYVMPDIVANVRVDQSWGSAMIKAALHQNRGGYYTNFPVAVGTGSCAAQPNTTNCGHPDDEFGYGIGAGFAFNIPGLPGSSISAEAHWTKGAIGYAARGLGGARMWGDGRSIGVGWSTDSVFRNGTDLELTESWGFVAGAEYRWNPQWRTSLYGGYVEVNYTGRAEDMICSRGAFLGTATPNSGLSSIANCSPDFAFWAIGTRTQWNPHPFLDIGLDVSYHKLQSAHKGLAATSLDGAVRPSGPVVVEDQDKWTAMFRVQYNMLP
jgi:hypothetical protein